jgi:hypothetical protein
MSKAEAQIMRDWLRHPGARIAKRHLKRAAATAMREYDKASTEKELMFIQTKRQIFNDVLPQLLDSLTYDEDAATKENRRFNWRRLLGGR